VVIWCGSTEVFTPLGEVHKTLAAFEKGLKENHKDLAPSNVYAYAVVSMGIPYINGHQTLQ
jgi:Myo-inositol-1-phosphate synthase.